MMVIPDFHNQWAIGNQQLAKKSLMQNIFSVLHQAFQMHLLPVVYCKLLIGYFFLLLYWVFKPPIKSPVMLNAESL